jgi:hypothetical protein
MRNLSRTAFAGILFSFAVTFADPTRAELMSGLSYLPGCREALNRQATFAAGACLGIVGGVFYYSHVLPETVRSCSPNGVGPLQATAVIVQYLDRNPALLHLNFPELAGTALKEAWPCPK